MRAFALGVLIVLATGLAFLLWRATSIVVTEDHARVEADSAEETDAPGHAPEIEAPAGESGPIASAPATTAAAPAPTSSNRTVPERSRADALETVQARVHGTTRALVMRRPGAAGEGEPNARRPVPGAHVTFSSGERVVARVESGRDGRFEARFAVTGPCSIAVEAPAGWRAAPTATFLTREQLLGEETLHLAFLSDTVELAGDVRGFLQSESGAWSAETLPKRGAVLLDLVSVSDPFFSLRGEIENGVDAHGAPTVEFVFRDVPRGEYDLALSSLDAFRWHPKALRVAPPVVGLSFLRYDREKSLPLVFRVFDARSREPITDFTVRRLSLTPSRDNGVFLHTGPIELGAFPAEGTFQWSLWSDGRAAAFGDERSFTEQDGTHVAEVFLEPGWSTKVLVLARDPTARPLANAEVLLDGERAGRTDAAGMLIVRAKSKPTVLDVRVDGFVVAGKPLEGHAGKSAEQRGQVTLVFLEPRR